MSTKVLIQVDGKPMTALVTPLPDGRFVASLDTNDTTALVTGDTREEAADNLANTLAGK